MEPEPPEVAGEDPSCTFGRCLCCWLRSCSSRIPPVAPGRDYHRVPLGADDKAAWSLLVGFLPPSSARTTSLLRLRRFCVAQSGRILGRSDDALEILDDVDYDARGKSPQISPAAASPGANGCSLALCHFFLDFGVPGADGKVEVPGADGKVEVPGPVELLLDLFADRRICLNSLPPLPPHFFMPFHPISASGDIWAPCFLNNCGSTRSLVMLRLDRESEQ
ncbi:unnamed protein product [Urochloa humidicola]